MLVVGSIPLKVIAEYNDQVAPCDARREFISGFSGSAGVALILQQDQAKLFTDGRYTLQAKAQLDNNWDLYIRGVKGQPLWNEYVAHHLPKDCRVGVDATTLSIADAQDLIGHHVHLVPTSGNLVDQVWSDQRPARPANPIFEHPNQYSGLPATSKIARLRESFKEHQAQALVVAALDEVAWTLNLRGCSSNFSSFYSFCPDSDALPADIDYNPVFFSYLLITESNIFLFIDQNQLSADSSQYLKNLDVQVKPYDTFLPFLQDYAAKVQRILIPNSASWAIYTAAGVEKSHQLPSPIALPKALKNETELQGFRKCHIRDGAALVGQPLSCVKYAG